MKINFSEKKTLKTGLAFILISIMFVIGISMFTYRGTFSYPIVKTISQICFLFWLPMLFIGLIISTISLLFYKRRT